MARNRNTDRDGNAFDQAIIESVWRKGKPELGLPNFRQDVCRALMEYGKYGKTEQWGWEIDHIIPVAKGGTDALSNLEPLQWENNMNKGDCHPNWDCLVRM